MASLILNIFLFFIPIQEENHSSCLAIQNFIPND